MTLWGKTPEEIAAIAAKQDAPADPRDYPNDPDARRLVQKLDAYQEHQRKAIASARLSIFFSIIAVICAAVSIALVIVPKLT